MVPDPATSGHCRRSCSRTGTRSWPPRAIPVGSRASAGMTGSPGSPWSPTIRPGARGIAPGLDVIYSCNAIGQPGFRDRRRQRRRRRNGRRVDRIVYLGGFVPDDDILSSPPPAPSPVAGGPCRLGAAVIIGAGSTWFDGPLCRDRLLIRCRRGRFSASTRSDVLHYLVAAGDADRVTAGAYDLVGPGTATYAASGHLPYGRAVRCGAGLPLYEIGGGTAAEGPGGPAGRGDGSGADRTGRRSDRLAGSSDDGIRAVVARLRARSRRRPDQHRGCGRRISCAALTATSGRAGGPITWPTATRSGPAGMCCESAGCRRGDTADGAARARGLRTVPGTIAGAANRPWTSSSA